MRVLLASNHGADRSYGGAERYVDDLARALRARDHEVRLLSAFPVRDASAPDTVTLHATDWREDRVRRYRNHVDDWVARPWPRLEPLLRELGPDLLHTNNLPGISTGLWEQARRLGIPVVHTLHDYHLLCPRTSLIRADGSPCQPSPLLCGLRSRRMARWAGGVSVAIGVSAHVLGRHEGFFPPRTERRVIRAPLTAIAAPRRGERHPNGSTDLHPDGSIGHPAPAIPPATIGYLGALTAAKGVRLLLDAAPALAAAGLTLRIAGDGPLRAAVEAAVEAAGGVQYAGRIDPAQLGSFLDRCDLGVIPSLWEEPGLTYVLCEWLASGRPVLCTRRGGLAEAAALGGVDTFEPTADGLVAAAAGLRTGDRWPALLAGLPGITDDRDLERWTNAHLSAYTAAIAR